MEITTYKGIKYYKSEHEVQSIEIIESVFFKAKSELDGMIFYKKVNDIYIVTPARKDYQKYVEMIIKKYQ